MRKVKVFVFIASIALAGVFVGVLLTARLDGTKSARAVDYFKEGDVLPATTPPAQRVAFSNNGLPSFAELAKRVSPAVVNISTTKKVQRRPRNMQKFRGGPRDPFFDDFFDRFFEGGPQTEQPQKSLGSGFIINKDGYILTNNHVVEGADEVQVVLSGKNKYTAKVIGADTKTDIAVIKIAAAQDLPFAVLGDSEKLAVGDWVMAVGDPFGLDHTVTAGIVSAKGRVIGAGPYDDFIQTDASINPGNSGGPLFNLQGEVVGVNTAIVASGQGIGFAIPINMAKQLIPQLISSGKVTRAWLGVGIQDITPELAKSFNLSDEKGALVSSVFPNSPAEKGGLKSGDVIRGINGKEIGESHELPSLVAREPVGSKITLRVLRNGKEQDIGVTLGEMEKGEKVAEESTKTSSAQLGLSVREITPEEAAELQLPPENHGVLIAGIEQGSEAEGAGVQRGDVLLSLNDQKISSSADFMSASKKVKGGSIVRLYIKRQEATIFLAFTKR